MHRPIFKILLVVCLMAPALQDAIGQGILVRGKVTDAVDNEPIIGGTIVEVDQEQRIISGTVTNVNGDYVFEVTKKSNSICLAVSTRLSMGSELPR